MASWRKFVVLGVLTFAVCLATSSAVQAQSLFERLGQVLNQDKPESEEATPDDEAVPEVVIPEALPSPQDSATRAAPLRPGFSGRPTLGVTVDPLNDQIVRQRRLPVRSGAFVTALVQGSPADRAGLPLGAVIVALDGRRIDSPADLVAEIQAAPTNRPVELSYYDGDQLFRKRIYLVGTAAPHASNPVPGPVRREPTSREPQPLNRGPSLEQQLGGGGQRPVLGRFGQLLDGLVAPASGATPLAPAPAAVNETALLREQVSVLQQELAVLRARLSAVEKQLEKASPAE